MGCGGNLEARNYAATVSNGLPSEGSLNGHLLQLRTYLAQLRAFLIGHHV